MTMRRSSASLRARRASLHTPRIDAASRRPDSSSTRASPVSLIAIAAIVVRNERSSQVDELELRAEDAHAIAFAQQRLVALRNHAGAPAIHLHRHVPARLFVGVRP